MNIKIMKKLIDLYDDIYTERPYKLKMVCFIVYKGKILSWGVNSDKTSTTQHYWRVKTKGTENYIYDKRHAEIDAIKKLPHEFKDFKKAELFIISKKKNGNFRLAKPCPICQTMLSNYDFKSIYYTTNENTIDRVIKWSFFK